eukprot:scaffold92601_cov75-Cyclotella_meneghiniana.AAC.9
MKLVFGKSCDGDDNDSTAADAQDEKIVTESDTPGQCLLPQLLMVEVKVEVERLTSPSKTAANGSFLSYRCQQ